MTLVAAIALGLVAILYVGWTVLGLKVARRAHGKDATIWYRQTVAFAVIALAFAGLAFSLYLNSGAFGYAMCGLIAAAFIFKRFNIQRLTPTTSESD